MYIFYILSPTRLVFDGIRYVGHEWTYLRAKWPILWLTYSLILINIPEYINKEKNVLFYFAVILICIGFSRINEIVYAFITDAINRIDTGASPKGSVSPAVRVHRVGMSYAELICHFALIDYLIQKLSTDRVYSRSLNTAYDALYFSTMTITTTGYGDIAPIAGITKLLSMYEALSGSVLFVLVLGVYLGLRSR